MIDTLFSALFGGSTPDYDYYENRQKERAVKPRFAPRALADDEFTASSQRIEVINTKANALLHPKSFFTKPKQLTLRNVVILGLATYGAYHLSTNILNVYVSAFQDIYNAWTAKTP